MSSHRTCAVCNGDCHQQNIDNFAASTAWRERAFAAESSLSELHALLSTIRQRVIEGEISGKLNVSEFSAWDRAGKLLREAKA